MTAITFNAKGMTEGVNYNPFRKLTLETHKTETQTNFLAQTLKKEVMQGTVKEQKKKLNQLKKLQKKFVLLLGTGATVCVSPIIAFAQSPGAAVPVMANVTTQAITPAVVSQWGLTIALMAVAIGVAVSSTLLAAAGVYRMFKKREEATAWTTDIIKGLVQVLIAIPVVYSLFYLSQIVFQGLPMLNGLF